MNTSDAMMIASRPLLIIIVGICMASDLQQRRISNRLILFGIIICFALAVGSQRYLEVLRVAKDLSLPVIIFYLLYQFKVLGAGDIKLISLISGFIGTTNAIKVMLVAFIIGGIWSVIVLVQNNALRKNMEFLLGYIFAVMQGDLAPYPVTSSEREPLTIPFSVCIGGALYAFFLLGT